MASDPFADFISNNAAAPVAARTNPFDDLVPKGPQPPDWGPGSYANRGEFAYRAADTGTFGGLTYLRALVRSKYAGIPYQEALQAVQRENEQSAKENRNAHLLGTGAGFVLGGGAFSAAGKGVKALGAGDALNPFVFEKGTKLLNATKMGITGGAISGAQAAIEDKNVPFAMGVGGVTSMVVGAAASKLAESLAPATYKVASMMEGVNERFGGKAWALAGKILGEKPEDLANAAATAFQRTGKMPSLADLSTWVQQGKIQQLARQSPNLANAMREKEMVDRLASRDTLRTTLEDIHGGPMLTEESLAVARKARMDATMAEIRDKPVAVSKEQMETLNDNMLRAANKRNKPFIERLDQAAQEAESNGVSNRLTVGDIDTLRKTASNLHGSAKTANEAQYFKGLKNDIADIGTNVESRYGQALAQYNKDSIRLEAFKHGRALRSRAEIEEPFEAERMRSAAGNQGYREGVLAGLHEKAGASPNAALATANRISTDRNLQNLLNETGVLRPTEMGLLRAHAEHIVTSAERNATMAPSALASEEGQGLKGAIHTATGIIAGSHGSPSTIYHGLSALKDVTGHKLLPPGVGERVASYLTNPKYTQQGINILKRAGATNQQIQDIMRSLGPQAGRGVADVLGE